MAEIPIGAPSGYTSLAQTQADRLIQRLHTGRVPDTDEKIEKSAKDFEALLLSQWLQQAEQSFACVPGGEQEDQDADPGADQFQGIAMQSLATALTNSGGIGIAKLISGQLHRAQAGGEAEGSSPAAGGMFFREMPK